MSGLKQMAICGSLPARRVDVALLLMFTIAPTALAQGRAIGRTEGINPADAAALRYQTQWALLVGIDDYANLPPNKQLQFAKADVEALRKLLIEEYGYRPEHVVTLTDAGADKQSILEALYGFADKTRVGEDDSLLIYFSGHGKDVAMPAGGQMGFLIPHDGKVDLRRLDNPAPFLTTCVSMDELNKTARAIPAKHILFLVDCCYSGMAAEHPRSIEAAETVNLRYLRKLLNFPVRQIITAGSSGEEVVEKASWGHSAFCFKLLEALRRGRLDTDADGVILASELGVHLQKAIPNIPVAQTPQTKVLTGEGGFVFFYGGPDPSDRVPIDVPPGADDKEKRFRDALERARRALDEMEKLP